MAAWIYCDLSCPVAERKNFLVELLWVINRGASIWPAYKISEHEIENMTVTETKKRHMPLAQLKIMFFFFLTQGHYSYQVSCTRLKSEPVLLLQNVNRVLWPSHTPDMLPNHCSLHRDNTPAHDTLTVWEFLAKKFVIKLEYPLYLQDLALKTFSYSQNSHAFSEIHKFRHMQWPSWRAFQKKGFSNVLNNGNTDSLSVLLCKLTTLKVIEAISVKIIKYFFYGGFQRT